MVKGFMQLKNVQAGSLVRFKNGSYAMISEYRTGNNLVNDGFIYGSGEALHANGDVWVAVIDLDVLDQEQNFSDELVYPENKYPLGIEDLIEEDKSTYE